MILGLITDRTQANVDRRSALAKKGWYNMTAEEQAEWSGNPLLADGGVNLIPNGESYAEGARVQYRSDAIIVHSLWDGTYIYAILVIGPASDFEGKTMTFSLDSFFSSGGGTPQAALYWHDSNGYEYAGAALTDAGSVSFTVTENTGARENLALYLYATTDTAITAGAYIRYNKLMLEMGSTKHDYIRYYAVLPTPTTKGAYNYSDLNRVEAAIAELNDRMDLGLETKTNWTNWDIPKAADINRILGSIATLRVWIDLPDGIPETPTSLDKMTYVTANNIEIILDALSTAADAYLESGEVYSGEVT